MATANKRQALEQFPLPPAAFAWSLGGMPMTPSNLFSKSMDRITVTHNMVVLISSIGPRFFAPFFSSDGIHHSPGDNQGAERKQHGLCPTSVAIDQGKVSSLKCKDFV